MYLYVIDYKTLTTSAATNLRLYGLATVFYRHFPMHIIFIDSGVQSFFVPSFFTRKVIFMPLFIVSANETLCYFVVQNLQSPSEIICFVLLIKFALITVKL